MSERNDGGLAFPLATTENTIDYPGMTFRDYVAVHAMAIVPQQNATNMRPNESGPDYVARRSYEYADAMLKRREA